MTYQSDIINNPNYIPVLDHGFVGLIDIMGDDSSIDQAARCSYGKGTRSVSDMRSLIRYLMRHQHTSPFEMVELKFHLKMPIFVARQHIRHRTASVNEYSGRYSEMTDEMYLPELERYQEQSLTNKQGSGNSLPKEIASSCMERMKEVYNSSFKTYKETLNNGLSRELARIQLPLANYTEMYWKIDLRNFFHYIALRMDSHAQYEIRKYAEAMYRLVKSKLPIACEAFEDYTLNGVKFSRMELDLLRRLISSDKWIALQVNLRTNEEICKKFNISERELNEFKEKLSLK